MPNDIMDKNIILRNRRFALYVSIPIIRFPLIYKPSTKNANKQNTKAQKINIKFIHM